MNIYSYTSCLFFLCSQKKVVLSLLFQPYRYFWSKYVFTFLFLLNCLTCFPLVILRVIYICYNRLKKRSCVCWKPFLTAPPRVPPPRSSVVITVHMSLLLCSDTDSYCFCFSGNVIVHTCLSDLFCFTEHRIFLQIHSDITDPVLLINAWNSRVDVESFIQLRPIRGSRATTVFHMIWSSGDTLLCSGASQSVILFHRIDS